MELVRGRAAHAKGRLAAARDHQILESRYVRVGHPDPPVFIRLPVGVSGENV